MALFQKKIGPVFLKEESDAARFISKMQELENRVVDPKRKAEIQKQIKLAAYGEYGEKNISFELKNSGMDMYVIHDIYLEYGDLSAQIDYLVITRQYVYLIECKNLIGNIEIDNQGNFIRTYELCGKKIKEGIYSPITQNQRHLEVLKQVRKQSKKNFIQKALFEHNFDNIYKSLVVLANPKTYLNARYAPKAVKDQVIRADQLINKMKEINNSSKDLDSNQRDMLSLAEFFLSANLSERSDYAKAYEEMADQVEETNAEKTGQPEMEEESPITESGQGGKTIETSETAEAVSTEKTESMDTEDKLCPRCGNKMILRTAVKGANAGNRFYGCSRFPKCRYIETIDE